MREFLHCSFIMHYDFIKIRKEGHHNKHIEGMGDLSSSEQLGCLFESWPVVIPVAQRQTGSEVTALR